MPDHPRSIVTPAACSRANRCRLRQTADSETEAWRYSRLTTAHHTATNRDLRNHRWSAASVAQRSPWRWTALTMRSKKWE